MDGITMKGRYPENIHERSPGPAAYDQRWQTIQNMVDTQKLVSSNGMGGYSAMGSFNPKNTGPGPGHYYIPCTVADVPKYVLPNPDQRYKWV